MLNTGYYCEWVCFDILSSKVYVKCGRVPTACTGKRGLTK